MEKSKDFNLLGEFDLGLGKRTGFLTGRDSGENENAIKTFVSTDSDPFQVQEFTINNAEMAARNMANNEKDRKYQWQTCSQLSTENVRKICLNRYMA